MLPPTLGFLGHVVLSEFEHGRNSIAGDLDVLVHMTTGYLHKNMTPKYTCLDLLSTEFVVWFILRQSRFMLLRGSKMLNA